MKSISLLFFLLWCLFLFGFDFYKNRRAFWSDGIIRVLSCIIVCLLMVCDFSARGGELPAADLAALIALCDCFLLMIPMQYEYPVVSAVCIALGGVVSFILILPAAGLAGQLPVYVRIVFVCCGAMSVSLIARAFDRYSSLNLLIKNVQVPQDSVEMARMFYSLQLFILLALFLSFSYLPPRQRVAADWTMVFLLSPMMLFLYYTSCTGRAFFYDNRRKKVQKADRSKSSSTQINKAVKMEVLYARLQEYMETNRPFLNEKLTLLDVAQAMCTNKVYLSRTVNTMFGNNFCQFVNFYRIRYASDMMKKDKRLKVLEVAMMSGFHSVASFNMAFKLYMNDVPSEFNRNSHSLFLSRKKGEAR